MENASKALIIAGAILLSILIISLALWIFNSAQDTINSAGDMSEQTITTFNNKFTSALGRNVRGSEVNALIQTVRSNNQRACEEGTTEKIVCIYTSGTILNGGSVNSKTTTKSGVDVNLAGTVGTTTSGTGSNLKTSVTGTVATGNTYTVTCNYYKGLINEIAIKANT